ncbi:cathepsin G-like [Erinaceus europaeus]|uniref:Cathepsin G-like n=1 Tax=Erinaceus europaeus TaxID=9365 RepID=A0ABM3W0P1_ERIEU|nr:cathepsin G-like [Erinaceus europaeus]
MQPLLLLVVFLLPPRTQTGQIIGGREARPHSHPYMAYLRIQAPVGTVSCGGFLVREDFVLTAAHCHGSSIVVTLGAHDIGAQERTQQRIPVSQAIRHPDYNQEEFQNDIMLLKLQRRARRNSAVRPVSLPTTRNTLRPGTRCSVAGWGLVGLNRRTEKLHEVQLQIESNQECNQRFSFFNLQTQICVGDSRERKSAFRGDSGGPLVCNRVAQGIVSYGSSVGIPPAVFTRISSFMPWIKRTMRRFTQSD